MPMVNLNDFLSPDDIAANLRHAKAALVGRRLRAARRSAGLSRKEVVRKLRVNLLPADILKSVECGTDVGIQFMDLPPLYDELCALYAIPREWLDAAPLRFDDDDAVLGSFWDHRIPAETVRRWFRVERATAATKPTDTGTADKSQRALAHRNGDET